MKGNLSGHRYELSDLREADYHLYYRSIAITSIPLTLPTLAIAPSVREFLDKVTTVV
jgi:hypothetical protein